MTSIKTSYSSGGSMVGSYFYEYEYEYQIPASLKGLGNSSMNGSFLLTETHEGTVVRVLGYGINLI